MNILGFFFEAIKEIVFAFIGIGKGFFSVFKDLLLSFKKR